MMLTTVNLSADCKSQVVFMIKKGLELVVLMLLDGGEVLV